ncbi:hypothetical protein DUNSADRAFT_1449 [Dunaliella salina]|uniref:C3H1-type domain-containing protein n=1 Tax=Dunaliella salina TaxID=3046 RepID=A0ABQ7FXF1_DUNSA|nr:hypothetical protein DUNSADRAFT_1449 [Dunaliella salina]|eukprot:KAF5827039.1 hypothetical protein DUNSADRAFT_1449 [Dunaliella salina]
MPRYSGKRGRGGNQFPSSPISIPPVPVPTAAPGGGANGRAPSVRRQPLGTKAQGSQLDAYILMPFDVQRAPWPDDWMQALFDRTREDLTTYLQQQGIERIPGDVGDASRMMCTKLCEVNTCLHAHGSSNMSAEKWNTDIFLRTKLEEVLNAARKLAESLVQVTLSSLGINAKRAGKTLNKWIQVLENNAATDAMTRYAQDLDVVREYSNPGAHWGPNGKAEDRTMIAIRYVVALVIRLKSILPTIPAASSSNPVQQVPRIHQSQPSPSLCRVSQFQLSPSHLSQSTPPRNRQRGKEDDFVTLCFAVQQDNLPKLTEKERKAMKPCKNGPFCVYRPGCPYKHDL